MANFNLGGAKGARKDGNIEQRTIGGNPVLYRPDFDKVNLSDYIDDVFTGRVQVTKVLDDKETAKGFKYRTAIVEFFVDDMNEVCTAFVNIPKENEVKALKEGFGFFADFFGICKSLLIMNGDGSAEDNTITNVDVDLFLKALDSIEEPVNVVVESNDGGYAVIKSITA